MAGPLSASLDVVVATSLIEKSDVQALGDGLGSQAVVTHLPVPWADPADRRARVPNEWLHRMRGADVVVCFAQQVPELVTSTAHPAVVQHGGAGVDAVDVGAFRRAGVGLVTASGVGARSVGDFAVAALLSLALRHPERAWAQRERRWQRFATAELSDLRVLVVGSGPVGARVCAVLSAIGCTITVARRRPELGAPPGAASAIGLGGLGDALASTDAVVLAIALGPQTEGLLGAAELARLPAGALVVNVGRGALVDENALESALRSGHLAGVWLDVFAREPLPPESTLWDLPNLRMSAHDATATIGYSGRLAHRASETVRAWISGRPIPGAIVEPTSRAPVP